MNNIDLQQQIAVLSQNVIIGAALLLVLLVFIAILLKDRLPNSKPYLFTALAATMVVPTLFIAASSIYLKNQTGNCSNEQKHSAATSAKTLAAFPETN